MPRSTVGYFHRLNTSNPILDCHVHRIFDLIFWFFALFLTFLFFSFLFCSPLKGLSSDLKLFATATCMIDTM